MTVTPVPPRSNPLIPAIIGFVLVIALAAGVAVAAYVGFQLFQRSTEIPAMLDPGTHTYITFTPNLQDLPNIERLNAAFPELLNEEESAEGEEAFSPVDEFLTETLGVDFDEDIRTWIGTEIGIAMTFDEEFIDTFGAMANSETMPDLADSNDIDDIGQFYLIMQSRDEAALNAFIEKVRARFEAEEEPLTETTHNGMTIYSFEADGNDLAFAVVKNHFVLSNHEDGIPLMADRREEESLSTLDSFRRIKDNLPESAIGYAFYNGTVYQQFWGAMQESAPAGGSLPGMQLAQENIAAIEGVGMALSLEETGLRFEAISAVNTAMLSEEALRQFEISQAAVGTELPMVVGANALVMVYSHLPEEFSDQFIEGLAASPEAIEAIESFESDTGISLEEDILSWVSGDMLMTVLPGADETLPVSGYVRLRTDNLEAAKAGIEKLIGALLQGAPESPFETQLIEGVEWTVLPDPYGTGNPYGGYTFVENDVVIAVGSPAIEQTGERGNALLDSDTYRAATQGLPENNTGVFYLNVQEIVKLMDDLAPEMLDEEMQERLVPFVAVAGAYEAGIPEDGIMRGELFIYIVAPTDE